MTKLVAVKISWIMGWYFGSYACANLKVLNCRIWETDFKTENVALCLSTILNKIYADSRKMFKMKVVPFLV